MSLPSMPLLTRFALMSVLCAGGALLNGCTDASWMKSSTPSAPPPALAAPDTVTLRLAEAAEKAAGSLDSIARIGQAATPPASAPGMLPGTLGGGMTPNPTAANSDAEDMAVAPPELVAPVTISWTGPVESFLKTMAQRAGYSFHASGAKPPVPVTVTIDAYNQPLLKVIKSAALQVTGKADVVLDASRQAVEVRYAPVDNAPKY